MSYTLEDFQEFMTGESTRSATYAASKWGVTEGEPYDGGYSYSSGLGNLIVDEEIPLQVDGIGLVEREADWGGEGDGAETGRVVRVTDEDGDARYFEQTGRYSSWDSTYYGDWYEVEPFEKTVVRYRVKR